MAPPIRLPYEAPNRATDPLLSFHRVRGAASASSACAGSTPATEGADGGACIGGQKRSGRKQPLEVGQILGRCKKQWAAQFFWGPAVTRGVDAQLEIWHALANPARRALLHTPHARPLRPLAGPYGARHACHRFVPSPRPRSHSPRVQWGPAAALGAPARLRVAARHGRWGRPGQAALRGLRRTAAPHSWLGKTAQWGGRAAATRLAPKMRCGQTHSRGRGATLAFGFHFGLAPKFAPKFA
jgi:hypothetical protein